MARVKKFKKPLETVAGLKETQDRVRISWGKLIDGMRIVQLDLLKWAGEAFAARRDQEADALRRAADRAKGEIQAKEKQAVEILAGYDKRIRVLELKPARRKS